MPKTATAQPKLRARLFVEEPLQAGACVTLDKDQSHYLRSVLRAQEGQAVGLFNGRDGEWWADIEAISKQAVSLRLRQQTRAQEPPASIWLCFAPLKKDTTNFAVEKACEAGASRIWPVLTRFTNSERVKLERLQAVAMEAAEQCERLSVPQIEAPQRLEQMLQDWPQDRPLLACAETGDQRLPLLHALAELAPAGLPASGLGLLVGPEGGFHPEELALLARQPFVTCISLGQRILRAETAVAVALGGLQLYLEARQQDGPAK